MSFDLPEDALAWQARVRAFVDQDLIPWEVEAELNNGEIPAEARGAHRDTAQAMGLPGMVTMKTGMSLRPAANLRTCRCATKQDQHIELCL